MRDPLDSMYCLAIEIAQATKKEFFLNLQQTGIDDTNVLSFKRAMIGGDLDEDIRKICISDMTLLTEQGNPKGITLLKKVSSQEGGIRNNNHMAIVYGWDDGKKIDLMLSLLFEYGMRNPILLESMLFNYSSIEDRNDVAASDATLYGPYKHDIQGFYDRVTFTFSKIYQIVHQYHTESPHNEISIRVLTPDPKAMISYIAENTKLIVNDFEGGKYSTGLLFKGKRVEIFASPKAILK